MTKLDAGLMTSLPASDPGSAAVWGSKRINPRPQSCLCLTWSGYRFKRRRRTDLNQQKHSYDAKKLNQLFPEIYAEVFNDTETQICSLGNDSYLSSDEAAILFKNSSENTFSSICINMRSLINLNNVTKFECLISALDFSPHIKKT